MSDRIQTTAVRLQGQCRNCAQGIASAENWPVTAPAAVELENAAAELTALIQEQMSAQAQLDQVRQRLAEQVAASRTLIKAIDHTTDGMFGPYSPQKESFGLSPRKKPGPGGSPPELAAPIIRKFQPGSEPGTLIIHFSPIRQASYQIEWYTDSQLSQLAGNCTSTIAKALATDLQPGQKYYFQIRAIRSQQKSPWTNNVPVRY